MLVIIYTVLIVLSTSFAEGHSVDGLPEPDGDLQYLLFGLFAFLGWLSWIGFKVYSASQKNDETKDDDKVTSIDQQLAKDIGENARQISKLSQANEFQTIRFEEHKLRTENHINELFGKIDSMEDRLGTKVDNLVNAIISQGNKND